MRRNGGSTFTYTSTPRRPLTGISWKTKLLPFAMNCWTENGFRSIKPRTKERETSVRGRTVTVNDDAVRKARIYYGYFALVSNVKMDVITTLETYRNRDLVEKVFGTLKEKLNLRRALVSSETSLGGKLFIEFVALIYLSYIKKQMQATTSSRTTQCSRYWTN